jgi:hypothetical protein
MLVLYEKSGKVVGDDIYKGWWAISNTYFLILSAPHHHRPKSVERVEQRQIIWGGGRFESSFELSSHEESWSSESETSARRQLID